MFIVIEGPDGSGKTTLAKNLAEALQQRTKRNLYLTAEPTRSPIGALARSVAKEGTAVGWETLAHLFVADRREHVAQITAALDRGNIVISERYALSTVIYQALQARLVGENENLAWDWLIGLHHGGWLPTPDITLLLRPPSDHKVLLERMKGRGDDDAFEKAEFQKTLSRRYRSGGTWTDALSVVFMTGPIHTIDAEQMPKEVLDDALSALENLLPLDEDAAAPRDAACPHCGSPLARQS